MLNQNKYPNLKNGLSFCWFLSRIDIATLSVRQSFCPLRSGILWKGLNILSLFLHRTVAKSC